MADDHEGTNTATAPTFDIKYLEDWIQTLNKSRCYRIQSLRNGKYS